MNNPQTTSQVVLNQLVVELGKNRKVLEKAVEALNGPDTVFFLQQVTPEQLRAASPADLKKFAAQLAAVAAAEKKIAQLRESWATVLLDTEHKYLGWPLENALDSEAYVDTLQLTGSLPKRGEGSR